MKQTSKELVRQHIFEKYLLQPWDGSEKKSLYSGETERPIHGVLHAVRTSFWITVLLNQLEEVIPNLLKDIDDEDIFYLHIVAFFHDAARQGDGKDFWEAESATQCQDFLEAIGLPNEKAYQYASLITSKEEKLPNPKLDLLGKLLQSADCLDIMRTKSVFNIRKISLWEDYSPAQTQKLIDLAKNILSVIAAQEDLAFDCQIMFDNKCIASQKASPTHAIRKQLLEQSQDCYEKVRDDISSNPYLKQYLKRYCFAEKEISYQPTLTQLTRQKIRSSAPSLEIKDDYFIKSIRAENLKEFLEGILPENVKHPLRPTPKLKYRVTGVGIEFRSEKKPQYSEEEKKGFSQPHAVSMSTPSYSTPIFHFGNEPSRTGFLFLNKKNVLLSNQLSLTILGSVQRPGDFDDELSAKHYQLANEQTLFSKNKLEQFKQALLDPEYKKLNVPNECIVRLRADQTCALFINTDTLETRLLAKAQANILKRHLLEKHLCKYDFEVPIYFYVPNSPSLHLKAYTHEENTLDCFIAEEIAASSKYRLQKYQQNEFNFLFALSQHSLDTLIGNKNEFDFLFQSSQNETQTQNENKSASISVIDFATSNGFLFVNDYLVELKKLDNDYLKQSIDQHVNALKLTSKGIADYFHPDLFRNDFNSLLLKYWINNAIKFNHKSIFDTLYQAICNNIKDCRGIWQDKNDFLELLRLAAEANSPYYLEKLLDLFEKNTPNIKSLIEKNIIHVAATQKCDNNIKALINRHFSPLVANEEGQTPLHCAAKKNSLSVMKLLIPMMKKVNTEDNSGNTPVTYAIINDNLSALKHLLAHSKQDLNCLNRKKQNILHFALPYLSSCILQYLHDNPSYGVDINKQDIEGNTPLHCMIKIAQAYPNTIAKIPLLFPTIDFFITNKAGREFFDLVIETHSEEILKNFVIAQIISLQQSYKSLSTNPILTQLPYRRSLIAMLKNNIHEAERASNTNYYLTTNEKLEPLFITIKEIMTIDRMVEGAVKEMNSDDIQKLSEYANISYLKLLHHETGVIKSFAAEMRKLSPKKNSLLATIHQLFYRKTPLNTPHLTNNQPNLKLSKH